MKIENRRKENTGLMESLELRTVRGRDREREREKKHSKNYIPKTLTQCFIHVCVQCTRFIQVLTRTDRSTIVLQCSLRAPTLTPKYIPHGISFLASSRFSAQNRPNRSVPTDSVLGFFNRSQPTRSSASSADPADVEFVSQHLPFLT